MHIDIHKMYVTTGSDSRPVTVYYKSNCYNELQIATYQCITNCNISMSYKSPDANVDVLHIATCNINCHISMYYKLPHANEQNKSLWQHIRMDNVNYHSFPH